jgi:hypothetical protein
MMRALGDFWTRSQSGSLAGAEEIIDRGLALDAS